MLVTKKQIKKPSKLNKILDSHGCQITPAAFGQLVIAVVPWSSANTLHHDRMVQAAVSEARAAGALAKI